MVEIISLVSRSGAFGEGRFSNGFNIERLGRRNDRTTNEDNERVRLIFNETRTKHLPT